MPDELATILRLVAEGALSPQEAAPIIEALTRPTTGEPTAPSPGARSAPSGAPAGGPGGGRQVRIRVLERGRQVVNLRIPLAFADVALRMVPGISQEQGNQIREAIAARMTGPIVDVEDEDGDSVLISVE